MRGTPLFASTPVVTPDERRAQIRVRGRVQGVGFRPAAWRHTRDLGLSGEVLNDGEGVLIRVRGGEAQIAALIDRLVSAPPPLARIDSVMRTDFAGQVADGVRIIETGGGGAHTQVTPDAALCGACAAETLRPGARRHSYPFTNCTHCGPRLSIVEAIPYDRESTTMRGFALCGDCLAEYRDPADRRFHAEAIACPFCGPQLWLELLHTGPHDADLLVDIPRSELEVREGDPIAAASALLFAGAIVAIKGLGGYQLACDAANAGAVARLRGAKHRDAKPFALMARDLAVMRRYARVDAIAQAELTSPRAPIVLLDADGPERLPEVIAPGLGALGFMLPTTPLHLLLMEKWDRPLVMTSGNASGDPQIIDDGEARKKLGMIASHALVHDRPIANRVDDSVVRVMAGKPRLFRRARGHAPAPIALPPGFANAPDILAMGGELKAAFCLVKDGEATLSQHQGDLEQVAAYEDYERNLLLYSTMFEHRPVAIAVDLHPDYLPSKAGRERAHRDGLALIEVQHHHAHVAACMAENGYPLGAAPVLGVAMDGFGWGADSGIWGGEFLLADYRGFRRAAHLAPVAMPGGAQAAREPWRNLYAQLGAARIDAACFARLAQKPLATIDAMLARRLNAPLASSCGRLFDAVAAALGLCFDVQGYEGDAAARLEAIAGPSESGTYGFGIREGNLPVIDPTPFWHALIADLGAGASALTISARFHHAMVDAIAAMAERLAGTMTFDTVALSGGCFQNRLLFEGVLGRLEAAGFRVLTHAEVPAGDGGLALGQASVAAARLLDPKDLFVCA